MKREEHLLMFQNHHRDMFPCWVPESKLDRENWSGIQIPLHFHLCAVTWPLTPYQSRAVGWWLSRLEGWLKGYSTQKCRFWIVYSTSCCSKPFFSFHTMDFNGHQNHFSVLQKNESHKFVRTWVLFLGGELSLWAVSRSKWLVLGSVQR